MVYERGKYDNDFNSEKYNLMISPIQFNCYYADCFDNWYYQTLELEIFHKINKNISFDQRALKISFKDAKVVSAPI